MQNNLNTKLQNHRHPESSLRHPERNPRHPERNPRHPERSEGSLLEFKLDSSLAALTQSDEGRI
jgi:hypothetical protein